MVPTAEERKISKSRRKAKNKAYKQTPEYKAKQKEYIDRPEVKARKNERHQTPEYKARDKARKQTPEAKARDKARRQTPEYKAKRKEHEQSPERKAYQKEHSSRPEIKAKRKNTRDDRRLKILQIYSKRLSKSNIPCCNCCGQNSHPKFLEIDHIAGIKQMDSEPELVKLGYSSKLQGMSLIKFIIENNFPKGFQILCTNCNVAKGMKKNNNECPMKNKPH